MIPIRFGPPARVVVAFLAATLAAGARADSPILTGPTGRYTITTTAPVRISWAGPSTVIIDWSAGTDPVPPPPPPQPPNGPPSPPPPAGAGASVMIPAAGDILLRVQVGNKTGFSLLSFDQAGSYPVTVTPVANRGD